MWKADLKCRQLLKYRAPTTLFQTALNNVTNDGFTEGPKECTTEAPCGTPRLSTDDTCFMRESFVWLVSHNCPIKETEESTVLVRMPELNEHVEEYESLNYHNYNAPTLKERDRFRNEMSEIQDNIEKDWAQNVETAVTSVSTVLSEKEYSEFCSQRFRHACPIPERYQNFQFLGRPQLFSNNSLALCMYIRNDKIQAAAVLEYYEYDYQIPDNTNYLVANLAYLCALPHQGNGTRCVDHIVKQHKLNEILVRTKALSHAEEFWDKVVTQNDTAHVLRTDPKMYVWTHGLVTIVDEPPKKSIRRV